MKKSLSLFLSFWLSLFSLISLSVNASDLSLMKMGNTTTGSASCVEPSFPSVTGIKTHYNAYGQGFTADQAVGTWVDSITAYDLTQATEANKPLYRASPTGFNNCPALQFDGSNDNLSNTTNAFNDVGTAAGTIYAVVRVNNFSADTGSPWTNPSAWNGAVRYALDIFTNTAEAFGYDGANKKVSTAISSGTTYLLRARWDSANIGIRVNNGSESTTACGALQTGNTDFKVSTYSGTPLDGWVAEIVTLNVSVSGGDDTNLLTYFNTKYMLY